MINNNENHSKIIFFVKAKRPSILIIESDECLRIITSCVLEEKKYVVAVAKDYKEGWNEYKKIKPDVILLDIHTPEDNGIELISKIRENDPWTLITITMLYFPSDRLSRVLKRLGVNGFIQKPYTSDELIMAIADIFFKMPQGLIPLHYNILDYYAHYHQSISNKSIKTCTSHSKILSSNDVNKSDDDELFNAQYFGTTCQSPDKYKAFFRNIIHNLKGEFLNISYSIKEICELTQTTSIIQEECDIIKRSVKYSEILLQRLRDYLDMGNLKKESIVLLNLLKNTEILASPRIRPSIKLRILINDELQNCTISVNSDQLIGVLLELINNAGNAIQDKDGVIELRIEEKNDMISISVRDNGAGIPMNIRKNLFKKQIPSKNGLGLGLFLCSKIIRGLGGELILKSFSGKGSKFSIILPKKDLSSSNICEKQKFPGGFIKSQKHMPIEEGNENHRIICGTAVHNLRGEFLHIGYSIKEIQESTSKSFDIQDECDIIQRSIKYCQIYLQRLLDYIDIGTFRIEPIDIIEILKQIEMMVRLRGKVKLRILTVPTIKQSIVLANEYQLMGVIFEIIDNAVNVLADKGGIIELKVEKKNDMIGISVRDNGPGVPAEIRKKLFKRHISSKKGLGLGLYLCNKVITRLGGKLKLRTMYGKGNKFTIWLQMHRDKKEL